MNKADPVFKAIAHPARRKIIDLLAVSARSVKELTAAFEMTQPAVSQHLRELKDAELVTSDRVGLEQRYRLRGEPLRAVYEWSGEFRPFFDPSGHAWAFAAPTRQAAKTGTRSKHGR